MPEAFYRGFVLAMRLVLPQEFNLHLPSLMGLLQTDNSVEIRHGSNHDLGKIQQPGVVSVSVILGIDIGLVSLLGSLLGSPIGSKNLC